MTALEISVSRGLACLMARSWLYTVVDAQVEALLKKTCLRAKENGRQIVMGQDI